MPRAQLTEITDNSNSYYESASGAGTNGGDLEMLDNELEELQIMIESFGFPDCGNLRSTKKKDVRLRMKCLQAMMKQR